MVQTDSQSQSHSHAVPTDPTIATSLTTAEAFATAGDVTLAARIALLEGRVTKLEGGGVVPPPVVPPPSGFPLPPPGAIAVPPSIDASGKTDVSAAWQTFLDRVPNGSPANPTVIYEAPGSSYLHKGYGRCLDGRSNIVFWRYGSILLASGADEIRSSGFYSGWSTASSGIEVAGGQIIGGNPAGATAKAYQPSNPASACGFAIYQDTSGWNVHDIDVQSVWGHVVYVASDGKGKYPSNIAFHDFTAEKAGLMGIAIRCGTGLSFARFTIKDTAVSPIDIEDATVGEPIAVVLTDFTLDTWGWYPALTAHAIQGDGSTGAAWGQVTIQRAKLLGGSKGGPMGSTDAWVTFWGSDRKPLMMLDSIDASALTNAGWFSRFNNAAGTLSNSKAPGAATIAHQQGSSLVLSGNTPAT